MEKNNLRITIVQAELAWEEIPQNLKAFTKKLKKIDEPTDLIVLPEMFTTGFSMNSSRLGEGMNGSAMAWMHEQAAIKNCVVTGGFICRDGENYYNRHVWMRPDGTYEYYDKRHLFRMGNENRFYSPGNRKVIAELQGWRFRLLTCYDLRFPVWARNRDDYDVLVYIANWPESRREHWSTLLVARAIENQSYVVGVNRVGKDGNQLQHSGDSAVVHPKGYIISTTMAYEESTETVELNYNELDEFRKVFPVSLDADNFELL